MGFLMKRNTISWILNAIILFVISSCGNSWYYFRVDPSIQDINGMEIYYSLNNYLFLENEVFGCYFAFEPRFGATKDAKFCIQQSLYFTDTSLKNLPILINNGIILVNNKDTIRGGLNVFGDTSLIEDLGEFSGKEIRVIEIGPFIIPGPIPKDIEIKYDLVFASPDSSEIIKSDKVILLAHRKGKSKLADFLDGR